MVNIINMMIKADRVQTSGNAFRFQFWIQSGELFTGVPFGLKRNDDKPAKRDKIAYPPPAISVVQAAQTGLAHHGKTPSDASGCFAMAFCPQPNGILSSSHEH